MHPELGLAFDLGRPLFEGGLRAADPRLLLRAAGLRHTPQPLDLAAQEVPRIAPGPLRVRLALGLREQVARVAPVVALDLAVVDLEGPGRDRVEHLPIVADQQHGAGITIAQVLLEPLDRREVEVVRRLVEDRQVGLGHQELRERDATRLTPGKGARLSIGILDSEMEQRRLRFVLALPAPRALERLADLRLFTGEPRLLVDVGRLRERGRQFVEAAAKSGPLDEARQDDVPDTLVGGEDRLLREIGDRRVPAARDPAAVHLVDARQHPGEAALAGSVAPDEPDLLAPPKGQRDAVEECAVADGSAELGGIENGHGSSGRRGACPTTASRSRRCRASRGLPSPARA